MFEEQHIADQCFLLGVCPQYDVKKIEEIVYDISLRGLVKGVDQGDDGLAFPLGQEKLQQVVQQLAQS